MIEGLKITIGGDELKGLCLKRAEHHQERAKVYSQQIVSMENANVEGMNYSGGDPRRALAEKRDQHENESSEMQFISEHLQTNEQYLLDSTALIKLGITKSRY